MSFAESSRRCIALIASVSATKYREEKGYNPADICADAIYMRVGSKKFCTENGIRFGGRPRRKHVETEAESAEQQWLLKSDLRNRSVIDRWIGTGTRRYGLDRCMTKLAETSKTMLEMAFAVMDAEKTLRRLRC